MPIGLILIANILSFEGIESAIWLAPFIGLVVVTTKFWSKMNFQLMAIGFMILPLFYAISKTGLSKFMHPYFYVPLVIFIMANMVYIYFNQSREITKK